MKLYITLTLALIWPAILVHSQISHGGAIAEIIQTKSATDEQDILYMPAFQNPTLEEQIAERDRTMNKVLTFAHTFDVDITPENAGNWYTSVNGQRIWRVEIVSEGAYSINVIFSKFRLPEGGILFIYNKDKNSVRGGFNHLNNKKSGMLPVMPVSGDHIVVEYQEPLSPEFEAELEISKVNHDYLDILNPKVGYFGNAGSCEINVSCNDGGAFYKRAVVKQIMGGAWLGSGALINTTARDGRPYVISANHNFENTDREANTTLFIFNYECPFCSADDIEGTREQSVAGANMLAISPSEDSEDIDFALMELSAEPPIEYRPVYLGWNSTVNYFPSGTMAIHHPLGDVKKISEDDDSPTAYTLKITDYKDYYQNAHYWVSRWDEGTTEGGSSGCPLMNSSGQIIGCLTAGAATCASPVNDFFYRLGIAWDTYSDSTQQLACWLDPDNTGERSIETYEPDSVQKVEVLTNVADGGEIVGETVDGGYMAGHNGYGYSQIAEKFSVDESSEILGVYFVPVKGKYVADQLKLKVWENNNGVPGDLVYQQAVSISEWSSGQKVTDSNYGSTGGYVQKSSYAGKQNYLSLSSEDVLVDGDFYIGFDMNYPSSSTDTFALYQMNYASSSSSNTAFFNDGSSWKPFTQFPESAIGASLWIDAVIRTNSSVSTDTPEIADKFVSVYPNPGDKNEIQVYFNEATSNKMRLKIYNVAGQLVSIDEIAAQSTTYKPSLSYVTKGIYMFVFEADEKRIIKKIFIE